MDARPLTIAKLAKAADVCVQTIRYYERRKHIAQPLRRGGAYRSYDDTHVPRVRFIRLAQSLGFTLDEIAPLLTLEDGTDRRSVRRIASRRLEDIRVRMFDLRRIEQALTHQLEECEADSEAPRCPIIAAIAPREP